MTYTFHTSLFTFTRRVMLAPLALAALLLSSCTTDPYTGEQQLSRTGIGTALGALAGAGVGALTGDDSRERRKSALLGAGIGALAGGGVGLYMDRQEARLRSELRGTGVGVSRRGDQVILNMPGNITFATGSAQIQPQFYPVLTSVTKVLKEYNQTLVDVAGHTDNVGGQSYNQRLSEDRALTVADFLTSQGINPARIDAQGYAFDYPIASNSTADGRQQNRRVEISLHPLR